MVNVVGSLGLKLYPPANSLFVVTTSAVAGKFTPKEILLVAFGSPEVIGYWRGTALKRSFAVTEPSSFTGYTTKYCPAESTTYLSLSTLSDPFLV